MTVIARFEVIPVQEGSMSTSIAAALRALDRHPVNYRTTATDTIIEADTVEGVFAAVQDAHQAIPNDRVITSVEIDEDRRRPQTIDERVASVERELGHPPQRRQQPQAQPGQVSSPGPAQQRPQVQQPPPQQASMQRPPTRGDEWAPTQPQQASTQPQQASTQPQPSMQSRDPTGQAR